jgi:glycosyltransferase involved in cell wall biosynthesis
MTEAQQTRQPPLVAVIANSLTPYRLHVHRRIVHELPQVRLASVFTHETVRGTGWKFDAPEEINPVSFGQGEEAEAATWGASLREWRKGGRIVRWLAGHGVSAVICLGYGDLGRVRIIRWCYGRGIPCFVWGDSNIANEHLSRSRALLKRALVTRVLSWCAGALAVGSRGVAYFEKYGMPRERIFLFPLEPDYALIEKLPKATFDEVRQRYALRPKRRRIVFSGRLVQLKRVDLLIDAFAALAADRPEWDLVIIGDGPKAGEWKQRVPDGLCDRVVWVGFLANQAEVTAVYKLSDVLALTSEKEAWALVVNEAAAAGLAIVCSSVPGAGAELVRDGVNGRVFPSGDLAALTAALREVTDPANIDRLKDASRTILESWRRRADAITGLRDALESRGVIKNSAATSGLGGAGVGSRGDGEARQ